jgi:hypothetical protein
MLVERLMNRTIPFRQRLYQVANAALELGMGGHWRIVHVIEYPKCGGSWLRNMLRTYRGTDRFMHDRLIRPRDVVMAHRLYRRRYRQPIVVVRDPRDVYVSFFHFETSYRYRDEQSAIRRYFDYDPAHSDQDNFCRYLEAKLQRPSHPWFFYRDFVDDWLHRPGICLVRYEDCLADPAAELGRMLKFLGDPVDEEKISATVASTSFEAVTQEKDGTGRSAGIVDNTRFHRKGVAGDWKNYFNEKACRLLDKFDGELLRRLDYESDDDWIARFMKTREMKGTPGGPAVTDL